MSRKFVWVIALLLCCFSSSNKINLQLFTDMEILAGLQGVTMFSANLQKTVHGNNVKMFVLTSTVKFEYLRKS